MTNFLALYMALVVLFIVFASATIFAFVTEKYKFESSAFSVGMFVAFLVQVLIIVDYNNTLVTAPKRDEKAVVAEVVSAIPLETMPSASSFTKDAIREQEKILKEFVKR